MDKILRGVQRFQSTVFPERSGLFQELAGGQHPQAVFIACADARVSPSLITQTDPGDLFICRNAGNIVPPHTGMAGGMAASIEYAVGVLNVPHIIVCGHTLCGAMQGALNPDKLDDFQHVRNWLTHSQAAVRAVDGRGEKLTDEQRLRAVIEQNVLAQLTNLRTHPYVAARAAAGKLQLHGWVYEIETGQILLYDDEERAFVPLERARIFQRAQLQAS